MTADRSNQPDSTSTPETCLNYVDGNQRFAVIVHQPDPATVILHVAGEIDLLTEPLLAEHLRELLANRPEFLIIDLSKISFMGATGLSVLIKARYTAVRDGTAIKLRNPSRHAARPLELMGIDRLFEMLPPATEEN